MKTGLLNSGQSMHSNRRPRLNNSLERPGDLAAVVYRFPSLILVFGARAPDPRSLFPDSLSILKPNSTSLHNNHDPLHIAPIIQPEYPIIRGIVIAAYALHSIFAKLHKVETVSNRPWRDIHFHVCISRVILGDIQKNAGEV